MGNRNIVILRLQSIMSKFFTYPFFHTTLWSSFL